MLPTLDERSSSRRRASGVTVTYALPCHLFLSLLLSLFLPALRSVADDWTGVELYHAELVRYLSLGGLIALSALSAAVFGVSSERRRGAWLAFQIGAVLLATLALWTGLVVGVHMGYGEWQSAPDAGDQAYADGAKLIGSVLFGWMPAGLLAALGWLFLTVARRVSGRLSRSSPQGPRNGSQRP